MSVSPEVVSKIRELYERGCSVREISKLTGIEMRRLYVIMKYYGIIKGRSGSLSRDVIDKIISDYLKGMTAREVAAKYGIRVGTVRLLLKSLRVKKRRDLSGDEVELLKKLFRDGVPYSVICKMLNLSKSRVYRLAKKHGFVKALPSVRLWLVDKLIELLSERGVVDCELFKKTTGRPLLLQTVQDAMRRNSEILYGKIIGTSTHNLRVFPAQLLGSYIVYLKSKERDALLHLLKLANPNARLNAVKNRVIGPLRDAIPDEHVTVSKFLLKYYEG